MSEELKQGEKPRITGQKRKRPYKKRRRKKRKDPNAPKKSKTAYFFFMLDKRPGLKEKKEYKKINKVGKEVINMAKLNAKLSEDWRNISPEDKNMYLKKAAIDTAKYRKEMIEYKKNHPSSMMINVDDDYYDDRNGHYIENGEKFVVEVIKGITSQKIAKQLHGYLGTIISDTKKTKKRAKKKRKSVKEKRPRKKKNKNLDDLKRKVKKLSAKKVVKKKKRRHRQRARNFDEDEDEDIVEFSDDEEEEEVYSEDALLDEEKYEDEEF